MPLILWWYGAMVLLPMIVRSKIHLAIVHHSMFLLAMIPLAMSLLAMSLLAMCLLARMGFPILLIFLSYLNRILRSDILE